MNININNNVEQVPIVWHKFEDRIPQKKEVILLREFYSTDKIYRLPFVCTKVAETLKLNLIGEIINIGLMNPFKVKNLMPFPTSHYTLVIAKNQFDFSERELAYFAKKQCPIMNRLLPEITQL